MKFPWLEELVKEGSVSPEARDEIMRDSLMLVKEALDVNSAEYKAFMAKASPFAQAATTALAAAGWLLWPKLKDRAEVNQTLKDIAKNKSDILSRPDLQEHREKAEARFEEITNLAPSVARNKPFVEKLVITRLHSGLTDADAATLSSLQATYTPRAGFQKRLHEKTAETLADIVLLTKEAGIPPTSSAARAQFMRGLAHSAGYAAVLGGMATVAGGARQLMAMKDSRALAKKQNESFEEAVRMSDPEREPLHANKERARQAFKTLVHFAPHVAADPQAARSFMNRMVSYDQGVDLSSVKDLADIEKNMSMGRGPSPFMSGFGASAKALGLEKVLSGAAESAAKPGHHMMTHGAAKDLGYEYHDNSFGAMEPEAVPDPAHTGGLF